LKTKTGKDNEIMNRATYIKAITTPAVLLWLIAASIAST